MDDDHFTAALKVRRASLRVTPTKHPRPPPPPRSSSASRARDEEDESPAPSAAREVSTLSKLWRQPDGASGARDEEPASPRQSAPSAAETTREVSALSTLTRRQRDAVDGLMRDAEGGEALARARRAWDPRATLKQLVALERDLGGDEASSVRYQLRLLISLEKELREAKRRGPPGDFGPRIEAVEERIGDFEERIGRVEATVALLARAILDGQPGGRTALGD